MEKKRQIYEYIKSEVERRGLPPTIREIGERFGISSTNGVRYFLDKLESEGWIKRKSHTARGINVLRREPREDSEGKGRSVPILGRVPAGKPSFSEEFIDGSLFIDKDLVKGEDLFAVKVNGNSMIEAGIHDGDIAIVRPNPSPNNGEIVVAMLDDEVTLKRLLRRGGRVILKPENPDYEEMVLSGHSHDRIAILGTVQAIVRSY
jgi:repressor LexA